MGRRGTKNTPTSLVIARGNPGHRPINELEPEYAPADLKAPADLRGVALAEWKRLAPELVTSGVLRAPAVRLFAEYCELVGEIARCKAKIKQVGYEDARKLKYVQELGQLRALMKQYASELGITPTSSAGVRARNKKLDAPLPADARDKRRGRFFGIKRSDQKPA